MADLTAANIDAQITLINDALTAALQNPKPNYKIGGREVNFADYIKTLNEQLSGLRKTKASIPSESVRDFDSDITDTGEDNTQYEGDSNV